MRGVHFHLLVYGSLKTGKYGRNHPMTFVLRHILYCVGWHTNLTRCCFTADSVLETSTGLCTVLLHDTTSECHQQRTIAADIFFTIKFILWTDIYVLHISQGEKKAFWGDSGKINKGGKGKYVYRFKYPFL